jgi:hypothetical protein
MRGDAQDVYMAGVHLHHEQDVEPLEHDRVDVEQISGQDPVSLGLEERPPRGVRTPRRGRDPALFQDPADRAFPDSVAETTQLTLDPPVAPSGIVACQRGDQVTDLLGNRRPTR